jgi:hypothetical protein
MTNIDTTPASAASKPALGRASITDTARTGARPGATKSAAVMKMLARARGATILEVATATAWQAHSVRAYFSGLRKKGIVLVRETRKSGEGAYRVETAAAPAADATLAAEASPVDPTTRVDAPSANVAVA